MPRAHLSGSAFTLQIGQLSGVAAKVLPPSQACCAAALQFQGTEKATLAVRRLLFFVVIKAFVPRADHPVVAALPMLRSLTMM